MPAMPHWKARAEVTFSELAPGLAMWSVSDRASKRGKTYYCYLADTERGNVLVHAPDRGGFYAEHGPQIDALGGARFLFLTHYGDADAAWLVAAQRWGAEVHGHVLDKASLGLPGGFSAAHALDARHQIVPLPGHTPGYSVLVRRQGERAYLFGGHFLLRNKLGWRASGAIRDMAAARASLVRLRELDVDVLLPEYAWGDAGKAGRAPVTFDAAVRARAVDEALAALTAKARRPSR
jgi:glyoxylase-like metal-dependent hydrolase (beta-lactamase superfamily II)